MDKELLKEIDARIRLCIESEEKLDHLEMLLKNKKLNKLEYEILKHRILNGNSEAEIRNKINDYLEKAVNLRNKIKEEGNIAKSNTIMAASFTIIVLLIGVFFILDAREGIISATGYAIAEFSDFILNEIDENSTFYQNRNNSFSSSIERGINEEKQDWNG